MAVKRLKRSSLRGTSPATMAVNPPFRLSEHPEVGKKASKVYLFYRLDHPLVVVLRPR